MLQSDLDFNYSNYFNYFNCFHNDCCLSYYADGPLLPAAHWTVRLFNA